MEENNPEDMKIREIKPSGPNIKEVKQEDVLYDFTCKRCGGHSYTTTSTTHHKFGGTNLAPAQVKVCRNCGEAEPLSD